MPLARLNSLWSKFTALVAPNSCAQHLRASAKCNQLCRHGAGWSSSTKRLVAPLFTAAQEEPLPARLSLVRYRLVPREGEAARRRAGPTRCLNRDRQLPRRLPLTRARERSIPRSNPATLVTSASYRVTGAGTSNCERIRNLSKGQRFPNLACSDRMRSQGMQEGLHCSSFLLLHPSALQHKSGLNRFPASHLKVTSGKTREARQSSASLGKPGTGMLGRQTGTYCSMAWKPAGLGAIWWDRVENNDEMEEHCFCSSQVLHPNDKSISGFGSS